jgi:tetratricopeptide (TPR) repeat protein
MNLGEYAKALSSFLKFQDSQEAHYYIAQCYHALGEFEKETAILKKLDSP